jgi:D-glycero-D-manno-heptose 1,7-bisphosphate phosphatase
MRAAVFLDRDGTINEEVNYLDQADDLRLIQGAGEAIHLLNEAALPAILITNQSAIGRGYFSKARLNKIHRELARKLAGYDAHLDAIYYCPHRPDQGCTCRKPQTGLLELAAEEHGLDLDRCFLIGDKASDVEAGRRAGCRSILVLTGYGAEQRAAIEASTTPDFAARDLLEAVHWILAQTEPRPSWSADYGSKE